MNDPGFNWSLIRSFLAALDQGSLMGAARALGLVEGNNIIQALIIDKSGFATSAHTTVASSVSSTTLTVNTERPSRAISEIEAASQSFSALPMRLKLLLASGAISRHQTAANQSSTIQVPGFTSDLKCGAEQERYNE